MALLLGDIHGNLDKAKSFIAYRPEEKHVFVGDYVDSFDAPDMEIYETLKVCIESDADLILGNHDLHYFDHPPFLCSGFRPSMRKSLQDIFEEFMKEERFVPALVVDGYIVTHGGVHERLGLGIFFKDVGAILNMINVEWNRYLDTRKTKKARFTNYGPTFNIGTTRGGRDEFSGIYWADYRYDALMDVPQIFGHSWTDLGEIVKPHPLRDFWALGCDNDRRICFNSTTKEVESF